MHWPASWLATKAYTSCGLCFTSRDEAQHWHALIARQLALLRLRGPCSTRSEGASVHSAHSRKPSGEEDVMGTSLPSGGFLPLSLRQRKRPAAVSARLRK
mgnify:CR=1 FL=1